MPIPAWTTSHTISPICTSSLMLSLTWVLLCKPLILCHFEVCLEQVQKVSILTFTFCLSHFDWVRSKILFCESVTILQVSYDLLRYYLWILGGLIMLLCKRRTLCHLEVDLEQVQKVSRFTFTYRSRHLIESGVFFFPNLQPSANCTSLRTSLVITTAFLEV